MMEFLWLNQWGPKPQSSQILVIVAFFVSSYWPWETLGIRGASENAAGLLRLDVADPSQADSPSWLKSGSPHTVSSSLSVYSPALCTNYLLMTLKFIISLPYGYYEV